MTRYSESLDTVLFQKSWSPIFRSMTNEDAGDLIKGIFCYMDGEEPEFDDYRIERSFELIMKQIERSARKYVKKVQAYECEED